MAMVLLLVIGVVVLGGIFLSTNIFSPPDVPTVAFGRNDGYTAQQKLYEVVSRQAGRSSRRDPIVITQPGRSGSRAQGATSPATRRGWSLRAVSQGATKRTSG